MKHKLKVHCASFEENAQTMIFANTPFNMVENHFLVHGAEKEFTSVFKHFSSF